SGISFAEEIKPLHFGVLAFRPKDITTKQWQPLAQELERVLKRKVELLVMNYPELDKAVKEQQLDFILTNPEHYILLKKTLAMNVIATMVNLENGHPTIYFSGVIFTRSNRTDIQILEDLNNKTIVAPAESSLGGYLMQRWELDRHNVVAKEYKFVGMPHDNAVQAVLSGQADAGFVRSGVIEGLEHEQKIPLNSIKVLEPHKPIGNQEKISALHSTDHYPEWPFCVSRHISPEMVRQISLTLLNIQTDSEIAKAAGIAGFNPPADYTPVEVLMLRLRTHPEELKYFNFSDVFWRYREFFVIASLFSLLVFILIIFLIRANKRLNKMSNENKKLLLAVEQSPVSIVITDLDANIEYVNQHFLKMTGYSLAEVIGKKPNVLKSGRVSNSTYAEMWRTLLSGHEWQGEIINKRKDGTEYIELAVITPVRETNGKITHYLGIKKDITERKKYEEQIKQLAFYDSLTGLANRCKLLEYLNYLISISHREKRLFSVLMMDLDKFKAVNDAFGHAAGDELLQQVSARIVQHLRSCDMVARLGGDEFVIVLEGLHKPDDAIQVALKMIEDLTLPFVLCKKNTVQIGASIGISFYPKHGDTPEKLIDHADIALYQAKDNGRGCFACSN
ncbi:partial putative signaling protein, partial [Patescibacteria group bacterium]